MSSSFLSIIESFPGAIYVEIDLISNEIALNASGASLMGFEGKSISSIEEGFKVIHPEDLDRVQYFFKEIVLKKKTGEIRHKTISNGEVRSFRTLTNTNFNELGDPINITALGIDTTREVVLQEQVDQLNTKLETRNSRYKEVIHDLKGPLGNIETIISLLEPRAVFSKAEHIELLNALDKTISFSKKLLLELLMVEKFEIKDGLNIQAINFQDFIQSNFDEFNSICKRKSIELIIDIQED